MENFLDGADLLMNMKKKHQASDASSIVSSIHSRKSYKPDIIVDIGNDYKKTKKHRKSSESVYSESSDNTTSYVSERPKHRKAASRHSSSHSSHSSHSSSKDSESSFDTDDSSSVSSIPVRMSQEEVLRKKRELLYQFDRLEKKGIRIPKKFSLSSSLEEMKHEYDRLKNDISIDISVKFQKRFLMMFATGVEYLNGTFNPFDFKLNGWSENVSESIDDYNDIFEELHEKYKGKCNIPPELKLLGMLFGSAFTFHLSKSLFSSMPGMEQVVKQNPDLMKHMAAATMKTMANNGSAGGLGSLIGNLFSGDGAFGGLANMFSSPPQPTSQQPTTQMHGPTNVEDILKEINQAREQELRSKNDNERVEMMSTISGSEITDIPDDASVSGIFPNKKKSGKRVLNI